MGVMAVSKAVAVFCCNGKKVLSCSTHAILIVMVRHVLERMELLSPYASRRRIR